MTNLNCCSQTSEGCNKKGIVACTTGASYEILFGTKKALETFLEGWISKLFTLQMQRVTHLSNHMFCHMFCHICVSFQLSESRLKAREHSLHTYSLALIGEVCGAWVNAFAVFVDVCMHQWCCKEFFEFGEFYGQISLCS